jgi:hypothetical protein
MDQLYALTMRKEAKLKELGYKVVSIWEHDFRKQLQDDKEVRDFVQMLDLQERIKLREAFYGGRTNGVRLHYKIDVESGEKIFYVDFTSLYPATNKQKRYPVGHPEIITRDFGPLEDYFGIAKVRVSPPHGLYHPVLPMRHGGKLTFPLCLRCAEDENQAPCTCTDDQRSIVGVWCLPEIMKAVEMGYIVTDIYEVYHWEETVQWDPETCTGGLFSEYVNCFLRLKQQAQGWPEWCRTEEQKFRYIADYCQKEGVQLEYEEIMKNPGLRALAKLCLNSFWGKYGQRPNMTQSTFIHENEAEKFFQLLSDPTKTLIDFHIVARDVIHVEWVNNAGFIPEDPRGNIFIASFTTCWARLELYGLLQDLDRRVLYFDTDSVIYRACPGDQNPPLGVFLGQLTDELDGKHIVEFITSGPKSYAYRLNDGTEVCKVKGFTLNYQNSQLINFDAIKSIVMDPTQKINTVNPSKITRHKYNSQLYNRPETKQFRCVYTKRVIQENLDTLPYGY